MPVVGRQMLFQPTQIAGCVLWLRADQGIHLDANGLVMAWSDLSGQNNTAAQATPANRPTFSASGWTSGRPAIFFPGTSGIQLVTPSMSYGPFSVALVAKLAGTAGEVIVHNSDTTNGDYLYGSTGNTIRSSRSGSESDKNLSVNWQVDNNPKAVTWTFDGTHAGHNLYVNGSVAKVLSNGTNTLDPGTGALAGSVFIGSNQAGALPVTGLIGEVVIYNRALSAADVSQLNAYFQSLYAVGAP